MSQTITKILISLGSFKDIFSPKESCEMIRDIVSRAGWNDFSPEIKCISIADGGEYSSNVISEYCNAERILLTDIINPYKENVASEYFILDNDTAFIASSDILRILPEFDHFKNPLNLTSYGLGQLINDAINRGFKRIIIGLGGTNTVDGGIGMAQALGVTFLDKNNKELAPIDGKYYSGSDLKNIQSIVIDDSLSSKFSEISIEALCDGRIPLVQMHIPNNQKIGEKYNSDRESINNMIQLGIEKYSDVINNYLINNCKRDKEELSIKDLEYFGVAGGINLSLNAIFNTKMKPGIDFFINELDVESEIKKSDLIITGEGRLDNSLAGKTPIGISRIAKKYNKPVLYLTGDVIDSLKKYFDGSISRDLPLALKDSGVSTVISCHNSYVNQVMPDDVINKNKIYRENTPMIFNKAITKYFFENEYIK